jgi:hypothetical protein
MRRRRKSAGGILWDAFVILVLCVGAFFAWRNWDRWKGVLAKIPVSGVSTPPRAVEPVGVRLDRQSALAQTRVRQFLADSGVSEKHILTSFNEQRSEAGVTWLEATMEIYRPKTFKSGAFLEGVLVFLSESGLSLMRDETGKGVWTLEFGDREHVFQRLVIRDKP